MSAADPVAVSAPVASASDDEARTESDRSAGNRNAAARRRAAEEDRVGAVALSSLPECGPARLSALIADTPGAAAYWWQQLVAAGARCGVVAPAPIPSKVWSVWCRAAAGIDAVALYASATDNGWVCLSYEPDYPTALASDRERPQVLFGRGNLKACAAESVAIIGTRRASRYGRSVARAFGAQLATEGNAVVSGLARGIDAAAHGGVMSVDPSKAIGVVGSGLDVVYPREHRDLWDQIASEGLLLSEAPPGSAPLPWRFPARNRIIAALSDAVLVVESGESGGSLHTVEQATQRGRPVLAVPGPVTASSSAGTNRLIADGIQPCLDASDVTIAISLAPRYEGSDGERTDTPTTKLATAYTSKVGAPTRPAKRRLDAGPALADRPAAAPGSSIVQLELVPSPGSLSDQARRVLESIDTHGTATETIVLSSGLSVAAVASSLSELQELGLVTEHGGWWTMAVADREAARTEERSKP